jgi:hypothetical protein
LTRSLPALLLLLALVAACGGPSPSPVSSTLGTPSPEPSVDASGTGRHAAPQLEALLPETLGGVTLTRESQRGVDLSQQSDALDTFLSGLGKTIDDFTVASAYSSSGDIEAQVGAWQIRDAPSSALMAGFIEAVQASSTTKLTVSDTLLSGHEVTQIGVSGQLTQGPLYAYVRADTILFVQTTDPALAAEAMALLP